MILVKVIVSKIDFYLKLLNTGNICLQCLSYLGMDLVALMNNIQDRDWKKNA